MRVSLWILCTLSAIGTAALAEPAPPANVTAEDKPNDAGESIVIRWEPSPDQQADPPILKGYEILRGASAEGPFVSVGTVPRGADTAFENATTVETGTPYWYQVVAVGLDGSRSQPAMTTEPVQSQMQLFDWDRAWFGAILVVLCGGVILFIQYARAGGRIRIRKIAGLEAAEEAVGRATEMGRSILFIPGIQDVNDIQTIAGITVLSRIARQAAEHGADLLVPTARSLVMTTARETVQEAYLAAGRPDAYNEDRIYYVTDEQFGYVAAVSGLMVREKPAACFYMGTFFAESLILAESGNAVGAIQVAGTAMPAQLPFFVAAADYTLIGEEFFAASAYLSGEPAQLGSLAGQDVGKFVAVGLIIIGCLLAAVHGFTGSAGQPHWAGDAAAWLVDALGRS